MNQWVDQNLPLDVATSGRDGGSLSGGDGNIASDLLLECGTHTRFVLLVLGQTLGSTRVRVTVHPSGLRADTKRVPVCNSKIWEPVNHADQYALVRHELVENEHPGAIIDSRIVASPGGPSYGSLHSTNCWAGVSGYT